MSSSLNTLRLIPYLLTLIGIAGLSPQCERFSGSSHGGSASQVTPSQRTAGEAGPIRIEPLEGRVPDVFVMRGAPRGREKIVFLHGMCGHALGYARSFQSAAAKHGTLIAPQGDVACEDGTAKWSADSQALDNRIVDAFRALGLPEPIEDVAVVGYSQGATRAEELARRWPRRYTRLVLIGGPQAPSPNGLSVQALVSMAGERDRQDLMKAGERVFNAAGIPSTYLVIPDATHGSMGSNSEATMAQALDWLFTHSRAETREASVQPRNDR